MTEQKPEHAAVSMTAREMAFFRAGRSLGRADAYAEAAKHAQQSAELAALNQWTAQMVTWFSALAKDVSKLVAANGVRGKQHGGKQHGGKQLAEAITAAVPNLELPRTAITKHFQDTAQALLAKADQAKAQFAADVAAADRQGDAKPQGVVRRLIGALAAELERR